MLQPLKQNPGRARVSQGASVPAPVEGWDAISPLAAMDPARAIRLENWYPQPGYVEVRGGYISWATGMTNPVQTLMPYHALSSTNDKLFAVAGATIWDVTSNAAASATSVTSLTSSRCQYTNFTTSAGTEYLIVCNGVDSVREFDGSNWTTPSITGVTSANLINVNVYKKYVWFVEKDTMKMWYLPLDSISGAAVAFPLGSVMGLGGRILAMGTWTRDGGSGPEDYAVFISSRGQVAVYAGTNPATDFELLGVYNIARPIGNRCLTKVAGDLAVITVAGVVPLSKALNQDTTAAEAIAITLNINQAIENYGRLYKANFGWEFRPFPNKNAAILNIPTAENSVQIQAVQNVLTGAWCKFTGWNMNTFCVFQDSLFGGGNAGVVYKMWTGGVDGTAQIDAIGQGAYNYFGNKGFQKRFTACQPLFNTSQSVVPAIGISTDFKDNANLSTPTTAITGAALWDSAVWDVDVWPPEGFAFADWTTVSGLGQCASLHFRQTTNSTSDVIVAFNGYNIVYEQGEFY